MDIPEFEIESFAHMLLPDLMAYYESEEGREEFRRWKEQQRNNENI